MINVMQRVETKYLLNDSTYKKLLSRIDDYITKDNYYNYSILNIYFDTENYDLIERSLEKPIYKEKVRLRSYGIPTLDDKVFLEIKKKYKGVVGKRRVIFPLRDFYSYLSGNYEFSNNQIMKEIDYCFKLYKLKPVLFLAYDRYAYKGKRDSDFRLTFDFNIRSREYDLELNQGDYGKKLFKNKTYIMEVKSSGGLPLWFTKALAELEIYPSSFSKYGEVYKSIKGDVINV